MTTIERDLLSWARGWKARAEYERDMSAFSSRRLYEVVRMARRELRRRHSERELLKEGVRVAFRGMANVMAGVTWALSCRAALREWAGHPRIGKGLQSGLPWLPWEMLACVREQVRARGWHPVAAKQWCDVRGHLLGELTAPAPKAEPFDVGVQFAVRMPGPTYAVARFQDHGHFEEATTGRTK